MLRDNLLKKLILNVYFFLSVGGSTIPLWVIAQLYPQENVGDSTSLFTGVGNSTIDNWWSCSADQANTNCVSDAVPLASSFLADSILLSVILGLRPPLRSSCRATSNPARIRSMISSRSISAKLADQHGLSRAC